MSSNSNPLVVFALDLMSTYKGEHTIFGLLGQANLTQNNVLQFYPFTCECCTWIIEPICLDTHTNDCKHPPTIHTPILFFLEFDCNLLIYRLTWLRNGILIMLKSCISPIFYVSPWFWFFKQKGPAIKVQKNTHLGSVWLAQWKQVQEVARSK
jgi:hypothetical protein